MRRAGLGLVAAIAIAGCRRDPAREAAARADALAAAIEPAAWGAHGGAVAPRVRVLVGPRGVDVDDAAIVASWPEAERRALVASLPEQERDGVPFVHERIVRAEGFRLVPPDDLAPGRLELPALRDALAYAREIDRAHARLAGGEPTFEGRANVIVHRDAPYSLVAAVLFTAAQAEHWPVPIARGPAGDTPLPLEVPRSGGRLCGPVVRPGAAGLVVTLGGLGASRPRSSAVAAELDALEALATGRAPPPVQAARDPRPIAGRMIVARDRACPSVPGRDGAVDRPRLEALLAELLGSLPGCDVATLVPPPDARWSTVVALADAARAAGYAGFQLGLARAADAEPSCAHAITPAELAADDAPVGR